MRIFILDGKDMKNRAKAYRVIEKTLEFPEWFGHNLDALADCLSEMDDEDAIVFVNTDMLYENLGVFADKLLSCFRDVSEEFDMVFLEKE